MNDTTTAFANAIEQMARHAGACQAILQACRLLRANGHREAADLLIMNVDKLAAGEDRHEPDHPRS